MGCFWHGAEAAAAGQAAQQPELHGCSAMGGILPSEVPVRVPVQTILGSFIWEDFHLPLTKAFA